MSPVSCGSFNPPSFNSYVDVLTTFILNGLQTPLLEKIIYRKSCSVLNGTENAACVLLSVSPSSSFNWFPLTSFPESISLCILVSELNEFWWTEYLVHNWVSLKWKRNSFEIFCLSVEKIKSIRLLEEMLDFFKIHPPVIQGNSALYWTHPCVWVSMCCICVWPHTAGM